MKAIFSMGAMCIALQNCFGLSQSIDQKYLFDEHHIRYHSVTQNAPGEKTLNWLFIPGGPGCDSSSLLDLAQMLELPGNVWLIDFPGNGSNTEGISADYDYNEWFNLMIPMVRGFENPVIVGASWGGNYFSLNSRIGRLFSWFCGFELDSNVMAGSCLRMR